MNLKNGVILEGYDPVLMVREGKAQKGIKAHSFKFEGAIYWFVSKENRDLFEKDPAKYKVHFGGYCAYGVAKGGLYDTEPEAFDVQVGRLFLQYNKKVRKQFQKDSAGNLKKADRNWPKLKSES